jgi:hypothetical protein
MIILFSCEHCRQDRPANPRLKGTQRYCGEDRCQRARKAAWQRDRLATDPVRRDEHRQAHRDWLAKTPEYWREYRQRNPEKTKLNRLLQRLRRQRARHRRLAASPTATTRPDVSVAKMDAFHGDEGQAIQLDGEYWLVPRVAKMDAFLAKITIVTDEYRNDHGVAKMDSIDQAATGGVDGQSPAKRTQRSF